MHYYGPDWQSGAELVVRLTSALSDVSGDHADSVQVRLHDSIDPWALERIFPNEGECRHRIILDLEPQSIHLFSDRSFIIFE